MDHSNSVNDNMEWTNGDPFRGIHPDELLRSRTRAGLTIALCQFEEFDPLTLDDGPIDKTAEEAAAFAPMLHTLFRDIVAVQLSHLIKIWVERGRKHVFDKMVDEMFQARETFKTEMIAERKAAWIAKEACDADTVVNAPGEEATEPPCEGCGEGQAPPPYHKEEDSVSLPKTDKHDIWPTEMLPFRSLKPWA